MEFANMNEPLPGQDKTESTAFVGVLLIWILSTTFIEIFFQNIKIEENFKAEPFDVISIPK